MPDLVLYMRPTCPYCQKVLRFMSAHDITLKQKNVLEAGVEDELVRLGGMDQVPCLMIDGKALYESDDIIAYLADRFTR